LDALSNTIGFQQKMFRRLSACRDIKGEPDFVLLADSCLLSPIEVKTKLALSDDSIMEIYNTIDPPACIILSIRQIFGYMAHNKCQYSVLSTYGKAWFLSRSKGKPTAFFMSEVVNNDGTSPILLRCFAHIISLAGQNSYCPSPSHHHRHYREPLEMTLSPHNKIVRTKIPHTNPSKGLHAVLERLGQAVAD